MRWRAIGRLCTGVRATYNQCQMGDATFRFDEFEADCCSPTVALVGRHRRGICDTSLVMHTPAGSPWCLKKG